MKTSRDTAILVVNSSKIDLRFYLEKMTWSCPVGSSRSRSAANQNVFVLNPEYTNLGVLSIARPCAQTLCLYIKFI